MSSGGILAGRTAVVTGGSRGIGRSIVSHLAGLGCNVVFTYSGAHEAAEASAAACNGAGVRPIQADVRDLGAARRVVDAAAESFGSVQILVNNAGIVRDGSFFRMSEADWTDVLDVNLRGCFLYAKAVGQRFMRQMGGRIINITSISALRGGAGQVNYSASKAGMIGLTKSLAREMGPFGVTVNAVAPGYIETEMLGHLTDAYKARVKKVTPLGRFGEPSDVASAVGFLASDAAGYITGQVLVVDGGLSI